jgi:hypothetical protein
MLRAIRVVSVVLLTTAIATLAPPVSAAISDPEDSAGPLDLRSLSLEPASGDRLRLTFSFWPVFRAGALAGNGQEGLLVRFRLPVFRYTAIGYTFFRDGHLRSRQGAFGSSACCYRSKLRRLDRRTLTTVFLPWWIRTGEQENRGVRYWARTKVCRDPCLVDHTRRGIVT